MPTDITATQLTNALRRKVASLGDTKTRRDEGCFVAEGSKCVLDLMPAFRCHYLMATAEWLAGHRLTGIPHRNGHPTTTILKVTPSDMQRMSQLKTPTPVLAVFALPEADFDITALRGKLTLALDSVRDPGNLGTIIRAADWFGVDTIIASRDCVDAFNPKVVQATMGALARVKVHYVDNLAASLTATGLPVYGTFLNGTDIYRTTLSGEGIIVMGNEGKGISDAVASTVSRRLLIPSYPVDRPTSESLNVAMATAITLAEFRRQASAR